MGMLVMVVESVLLIFGSLFLAAGLCMLLWQLLLLVRHPEYGALFIVPLTIIVLAVPLTHNPFFRMTLLFMMAGAIPFWIAGSEWRVARKDQRTLTVVGGAH